VAGGDPESFLPGGDIPDTDSPIRFRNGDESSVRRKRHRSAGKIGGMSKATQFFSGGDIPDTNDAVRSGSDNLLASRGKN
jgi:hypothetical protein